MASLRTAQFITCVVVCGLFFSYNIPSCPVYGQYMDDDLGQRFFEKFELEGVHRGSYGNVYNGTHMFNISQCNIDLMTCLENSPNEVLCSLLKPLSYSLLVDTVCPLMRAQCHEFYPDFDGNFIMNFTETTSKTMCETESSPIDYKD